VKKILERICVCFIISILIMGITPKMVANAADQNVRLTIKTGSDATDGDVSGWITFNDVTTSSNTNLDSPENDFEKYNIRDYNLPFNADNKAPWNISSVTIKHKGKLRSMNTEYVDVTIPRINGSFDNAPSYRGFKDYDWGNGTEHKLDIDTNRNITNHSFNRLAKDSQTVAYIASPGSTREALAFSTSTMITDQYGTYDCMTMSNGPSFTISVKDEKNNDYSNFFKTTTANGLLVFELVNNTAEALWTQMTNNDVYELSGVVKIKFDRVAKINEVATTEIFSDTIKLSRLGYSNNTTTLTNENDVVSVSQDNYYFNRTKKTFSTDMTFSKPSTLPISVDTFTAELLMGKAGTKINTPVNITKTAETSSTVTLNFEATIPDEVTSDGVGIYLKLTPSDISYDGRTYILSKTASTDNETPLTLNYYFSSYKVDTLAPTIYIQNETEQEIDLNNNSVAKKHILYAKASEAFTDNTISITAKNNSTGAYDPILSLTNPNGINGEHIQNAGISTGKLDPLRLELANGYEGTYTVDITGQDVAQNPVTKTFSTVKLDSLAPRVNITPSQPIKESDGSKRIDYTFVITDIAPQARVYYCFVPNGQNYPIVGEGTQSTGEASVAAKWYFVEKGQSSTTAILKVKNEESFVGKLYYYTDDQLGNTSTPEAVSPLNIALYNIKATGTINPGTVFAKKPSYDISFTLPANEKAEYRWVDKNAVKSGFEQEYITYTQGQSNIGSAEQNDKAGKKYILDGSYSLEYKITNTLSGNVEDDSIAYYFDNSYPVINLPKWDKNIEMTDAKEFSISISDKGDIANATYQIINYDGTKISQYSPVELNIVNGKVGATVTISNLPTGVYGLEIYAKDLNGQSKTVRYGYSSGDDANYYFSPSMRFTIRTNSPTVQFTNQQNETVGKDYYIKAKVEETVYGVTNDNYNQLNLNRLVKYQVSKDNDFTNAPWQTTTASTLTVSDGKLSFALNLKSPIDLGQDDGQKQIYIRVACFGTGEVLSDVVDSKYISDPISLYLKSDKSAPDIKIEHLSTERTNKAIKIKVLVYDELSDATIEVGTSTGELSTSFSTTPGAVAIQEYTISDNCVITVKAIDKVGNEKEVATNINYIDRTPPTIEIAANSVQSGTRTDGDITVSAQALKDELEFYLLTGDEQMNDTTRTAFNNAKSKDNIRLTTLASQAVDFDEFNKNYSIKVRGLTGSYKIGVKATDSLGNVKEMYSDTFTVTDEVAKSTSAEFSPKITKNYTNLNISFNVPVILLPVEAYKAPGTMEEKLSEVYAVATEKGFKLQHNVSISKNDIDVVVAEGVTSSAIYFCDQVGRQGIVDVKQLLEKVQFIDGFKINTSYYIDDIEGKPINYTAGTWLGINDKQTIKIVITPNSSYQDQYFYVDKSIGNGVIDEVNSQKTIFSAIGTTGAAIQTTGAAIEILPEALKNKTVYSRLVINVSKGGATDKQINFFSYTQEGAEADKIQSETIKLKVDETVPEVSLVYDNETETPTPTNKDVTAQIVFKDEQSGLLKVEEFINDSWVELTLEAAAKTHTENRVFQNNDHKRLFRITNIGGIVVEKSVNVTNIDKTPIEEGKHYNIKYEYRDYKYQDYKDKAYENNWQDISQGKKYREVMAKIEPIKTNKDITANIGSLDGNLVDNSLPSKTITISDQYGNTREVVLEYYLYDTTPPQIELPEYNKAYTNKDVLFTVSATDLDNDGEIAYIEVQKQDGLEPTKLTLTEDSNGVYSGYLDDSGTYTIVAFDYAGNKQTSQFIVDTISKKIPLGTVIYSTTKATNQTVMASVSFATSDITILDLQPVSGTIADMYKCITYTPGADKIRFKKNYSVNLSFKDKYGNIGYLIITVDNIKQIAPNCEAVVSMSSDKIYAVISFRVKQMQGQTLDDLETLYVASPRINAGIPVIAKDAKVVLRENGTYSFNIYDEVGNMQTVTATVSGIDKIAPKVTGVTWEYEHNKLTDGTWGTDKINGTHTPTNDNSLALSPSASLPETNQDVKVTVKTDKEITQIGSFDGKPSTETSMIYSNNGIFSFNLEGENKTSVQYAVDVALIDKTKPIIEFAGGQELVYIQNGVFDKNDLLDYKAFDISGKTKKEITTSVKVEYGTFNPDKFSDMKFNRNNPYYIKYSVYDTAGNVTEVTRTVRLIAFNDTIALINACMPNASNAISVVGDSFSVSLKNSSGKVYMKYLPGNYTMGEMKSKGIILAANPDGSYTVPVRAQGWYTVHIQTDKKDFFTISVYATKQQE